MATLTPATQEQQQPRRRFLSSRRHIVDTADDDEGSVPRSVLTARQREPLVSQQGPSSHGARTLLGRGLRLQGQLATDIVVSGSNTEDTDDDGSLPQLGQMLQFGRTHFAATAASGSSSSAGVAAGRGISSPRRVTLPTVSALPLPRNAPVDHRQVSSLLVLAVRCWTTVSLLYILLYFEVCCIILIFCILLPSEELCCGMCIN